MTNQAECVYKIQCCFEGLGILKIYREHMYNIYAKFLMLGVSSGPVQKNGTNKSICIKTVCCSGLLIIDKLLSLLIKAGCIVCFFEIVAYFQGIKNEKKNSSVFPIHGFSHCFLGPLHQKLCMYIV